MFDLPEQYKMEVKIAIKDFIPKDLKPETKKRIKEAVKEVELAYQITGEEIPSVMNEEYRCQAIQLYDIGVHSIKEAAFIANTYQKIIKSLCILRIHDSVKEVYSFALKRLSQIEDNEIVLTDTEYTESFHIILQDVKRDKFLKYMCYDNIINKTNKVNYYFEMYAKEYMIQHEKAYVNIEMILNKPIWYNSIRTRYVYSLIKAIVDKKEQTSRENSNAEKVKINQKIKDTINQLEDEI